MKECGSYSLGVAVPFPLKLRLFSSRDIRGCSIGDVEASVCLKLNMCWINF